MAKGSRAWQGPMSKLWLWNGKTMQLPEAQAQGALSDTSRHQVTCKGQRAAGHDRGARVSYSYGLQDDAIEVPPGTLSDTSNSRHQATCENDRAAVE
jgi:hypothetical protein